MCALFSRIHLYIYNMLWEREGNTKDFTDWVGHVLGKAAVIHREVIYGRVQGEEICLLHRLQYRLQSY